ncbi:MAG: hypothetical protein CR997_06690 [Acidobacteria bacterium]|nr:MAG: hypothetical protein CR997_06690 [Acidobacteriota bacterium]
MKNHLSTRRCTNHPQREAVVQCPDCKLFFCRECVTEKEFKMMCSSCLLSQVDEPKKQRKWPGLLKQLILSMAGFLFLWLCLYYLGKAFIEVPDFFQEDFGP